MIIAILTGVMCYFIVVVICIFLMISDVELLLIYMVAICMFPLEEYLFKFFDFLNWVICFFPYCVVKV